MKKILLHTCCTDCFLKFKRLIDEENKKTKNPDEKFILECLFYNPNIHPRTEYLARMMALKQVCKKLGIRLAITDWSPKEYFSKLKVNKKFIARKPTRCINCWSLRLEKTCQIAIQKGYTHFATTLVTSHYQNREKIEEIGNTLSKKYALKFYTPNLNSSDDSSCLHEETSGFYKQNYCGCCYSLVERMEEKALSS